VSQVTDRDAEAAIRSASSGWTCSLETQISSFGALAAFVERKDARPRHQGVVATVDHRNGRGAIPATYRSGASGAPPARGMAEQPPRHGGWATADRMVSAC